MFQIMRNSERLLQLLCLSWLKNLNYSAFLRNLVLVFSLLGMLFCNDVISMHPFPSQKPFLQGISYS